MKLSQITLIILALLLSGCTKNVVRDLNREVQLENIKNSFINSKDYSVSVKNLIDQRSPMEVEDPDQTHMDYCVPLLLICIWGTTGSQYAEAEYYDTTLVSTASNIIKKSYTASGIHTSSNPDYIIQPTLLSYYGVSYVKNREMIAISGSSSEKFLFLPTGYVSIQVAVKDAKTNSVIGSEIITSSYLLENPSTLIDKEDAVTSTLNMKTYAATEAFKDVVAQIPFATDKIIQSANTEKEEYTPNFFEIHRITNSYDYVEVIKIQYETGNIVKDKIQKRVLPIMSKPDEWVIAPIRTDGHFMNREEYASFVEYISQKYNVSFGTNLSLANFYR